MMGSKIINTQALKDGFIHHAASVVFNLVTEDTGEDASILVGHAVGMYRWAPTHMFNAITQLQDAKLRAQHLALGGLEATGPHSQMFEDALSKEPLSTADLTKLYRRIAHKYDNLAEGAIAQLRVLATGSGPKAP